MTPRPNCAGLPVIDRSGGTSTLVEDPPSADVRGTVAPAVPLPRLSLPLASTTKRRAASSFSTNVPWPAYTSAIGPSLTLHDPLKSSPETSVTVAPGKQPATDSMSWNADQVSATDAGTVKLCVSSKA